MEGESLWWPSIARNKRSRLQSTSVSPTGPKLVRQLVAEADIVLENFRPGTLAKWGMDYQSLAEINSRIILVHVSGFGQNGPRSTDAGFGSVGEAMGGIRHTTGNPGLPPTRVGISLGDSLAALFAVMPLPAAVHERSVSGRGQEVDVAIYEAVAALMESTMADHEIGGITRDVRDPFCRALHRRMCIPRRTEPRSSSPPMPTPFSAVSALQSDRPSWLDDPKFAEHRPRGDNMAEIDAVIGDWTSAMSGDVLLKTMEDQRSSGRPNLHGPGHARRSGICRARHGGPSRQPVRCCSSRCRCCAQVLRSQTATPEPGPGLGEHTRESPHWPVLMTANGPTCSWLVLLFRRAADMKFSSMS